MGNVFANSIDSQNPLRDLISDDVFAKLSVNGLLNEVSIRDRIMRLKFRELRDNKVNTTIAIEMIQQEYPYLQFETIKKIVHHPPKVYNKKREN